jgi:hypothetical protein
MIRVSDHALVRFLERSGAAEVEPLKLAIAASLDRARRAAAELGRDSFVVIADGLRYVVQDGVLVTVLDERARVRPR